MKPLGMLEDDLKDINPEDHPYAFYSKSKFKQRIFKSTNYVVWLLILIISLYSLNNSHDIIANFKEMETYVFKAISAIFAPLSSKANFAAYTGNILVNKSRILFVIILFINYYYLAFPIGQILNWFLNENKRGGQIVKWIAIALFVFFIYLIMWRIPYFVFSFFSFWKIISFVISALVGVYLVGLLMFFAVMMLVNPRPINKID